MERTLIDRGFAKETERNLIRFLVFRREGNAGSQRNLTTYNRVAAIKYALSNKCMPPCFGIPRLAIHSAITASGEIPVAIAGGSDT